MQSPKNMGSNFSDSDCVVETMTPADWNDVRSIYVEGIATGDATFETEAPDWAHWDRSHLGFARLIARLDDGVAGWAALSPVSARRVYSGVAEVSVYVAARARGKGVGAMLLSRLIVESEKNGIWTLQAGIFPENRASVDLHRKFGFREVGRRERIGNLHGIWRDVLLFERRSSTI